LPEIDVSKNTQLNNLNISGNLLNKVNLSQNTQLLNLNCDQNNLTQLDLSNNLLLNSLSCFGNGLTGLDLSNLTKIEKIYCAKNMLINLDVSKNTALYELWCESNNLRSLNVQNGNNSIMEEFHAQYNDSLNCIQVDDPTYIVHRIGKVKIRIVHLVLIVITLHQMRTLLYQKIYFFIPTLLLQKYIFPITVMWQFLICKEGSLNTMSMFRILIYLSCRPEYMS